MVFGIDGTPIAASALAERGLRLLGPGGRHATVAALLTNDADSVAVVLGSLLGGAGLVSVPPPHRGADLSTYAAFVTSVLADHGSPPLIARADIAAALAAVGVDSVAADALPAGGWLGGRPDGATVTQFSSGTTGEPKGICLTDAQLGSNVTAIIERVVPRPGDVTVSWLPLSHDLGLVGMLLTSVASAAPPWVDGGEIVLLEPEQFLRRPPLWMDAVRRWRGTFTAAPDFGYELAARTAPDNAEEVTSLRCAIVGGDLVRRDTLDSFTRAHTGFDPLAFCPAYGLAEVGLAVTMVRPDDPVGHRSVSRRGLADGTLTDPQDPGDLLSVVSSGPPLRGYAVDAPGWSSGHTGSILVTGPSIGSQATTTTPAAADQPGLRTGDLGFVDDDGLSVCGREDDHFVLRGRNLFAPTVERAVGRLPGVRPGRALIGAGPDRWVVAVEPARGDRPPIGPLRDQVRRCAVAVTGAQPDAVVVVAPGSLPFTSSGKPRRRDLLRQWLGDDLDELRP